MPASADIVVVGGGAAGMMAAIAAAEAGRSVLLLEKNSCLGRKVLVSGNGRCNLTNAGARVENFHGANNRFLHGIFARFGVERTLQFFESIGLALKEEKLGRIFPVSNQAASVVELLAYRMARLPIDVRCSAAVTDIAAGDNGFRLWISSGEAVRARRLVLAPGGKSFPRLGTTGDGYDWARRLGHEVSPLEPSLAPIETDVGAFHRLQGIRLEAEVTAMAGAKAYRTFRGDLLFTAYGLSGPTILAASADLAGRFEAGHARLVLNFFPGRTAEEVSLLLKARWEADPDRNLGFSFVGLLPGRMGPALLEALGVAHESISAGQLGRAERERIAGALAAWEVRARRCRSFDEAEVTAGGVRVSDLDPRTLESKKARGLYFCGEILDIFGDWGGYNFQFAWSTGHVAGREAAGGEGNSVRGG